MKMLIRVVINAIALVVAAKVVPKIALDTAGGTLSLVYVGLVALIFGLINTYIKPIASLMSLPLNLFAMGLVGFIVNAAMLLLTAFAVGILQSQPYILRLEKFPPNLSLGAIVAAVLGSIVISVVSTLIAFVVPD
jgi:putative membrane protein